MKKYYRKLSLVVCLLLFSMCFSGVAMAAEKAEYAATREFLDVLDQNELRYTVDGIDSDGDERVTVRFNSDDYSNIRFSIFFNDNRNDAMIRVWDLIEVSAGKSFTLDTLNRLNQRYRYGCFYFDEKDNTITYSEDVVFDESVAGNLTYRVIEIMLGVLTEDYTVELLTSLR